MAKAGWLPALGTAAPVASLPPLVVVDGFFQQPGGVRFTLIETSDFDLFGQFCNHLDITPVLEQRRWLGFNCHRVFSQYAITFNNGEQIQLLDPHYDQWAPFLSLLAEYGSYANIVAYTGPYGAFGGFHPDHWTRLGAAVKNSPNKLLSLVNENDQPVNHIDTNLFAKIPGILCSRGSNGSDQVPVQPVWDWSEYHTNNSLDWFRKAGHNAMEFSDGFQVPVYADENRRYPDVEQSLIHAYDGAAGCALLSAGGTFHSVNGRTSQFFVGDELDAAQQWAAGARSVPLFCQTGPYRHRQDLEGPNDLRVYQRGADSACIVRIRK